MFYITKYYCKGNQKEEQRDFREVVRVTQKMILEGRLHEGDRSEAMRRILRSTFQHNTTNVVGAPMAAYLNRNGSRFYFSHDFAWCSLEDMVNVLEGRDCRAKVKQLGKMRIVEKPCYNYLCRNHEYENMCLWDMVASFEVGFASKEKELIIPFENNARWKHPSATIPTTIVSTIAFIHLTVSQTDITRLRVFYHITPKSKE